VVRDLIKPANCEEVSEVLRYANENYIAVEQSIILSLERLNKILEVDKDNLFGRNQGKNLQRGD